MRKDLQIYRLRDTIVRKMKANFLRWGLALGLISVGFYGLRGDTSIPDNVLDSVRLLKKPIEDLLPDLEEDNSTATAVQEASLDLQAYQDMQNSRERWNEMRSIIESGQPLFTPLPSEVALSTSPVGRLAPAIPPPPGFTVQLPYESRLTVSGRKTIGLIYRSQSNSTLAIQQGTPSTTSNFELQQQLQVRINGQIGRKVTVNVDFDDTKQDKKDISIVYKGDPDEIVQRAAFGDITLSLPQTEFAGYNKQVFGATAELKYKALHGYVIGSRTKGQTETKEFVGNVILQRLDIPDTAFVRHRFYNFGVLATGGPSIDTGTIVVYLDTLDNTRPTITLSSAPAAGSYLGPAYSTFTYTGNFVQLNPGIDYTVDPRLGIITFRNILPVNSVVALNFRLQGASAPIFNPSNPPGPNNQLALLKFNESDPTAASLSKATGGIPVTEDLTHYNIGTTKIVRDNAQGNFILQVLGGDRSNVGPSININYLPNNAGQIFVDFEAGTFNLQNGIKLPYSDLYAATPQHHVTFFVEFRARVKTYTLRPNIVLNSERILLNGRVLTRDVDYFIDYESGFVTFFNEDQITEDSRITSTYDFSPFGIAGAQQDTLVGERVEASFYPIAPILGQSLIGSTVIYDFAPKQTAAPDIRQTAGSFLVEEGDIHFKDLIFNPFPLLKSSFGAEIARSVKNPNTFGQALIDNMEGIKDETSISLSEFNFQIARNPAPPGSGDGVSGDPAFADAMALQTVPGGPVQNLNNETIRSLDINPNAAALSGDRMQVLDINYNLTRSTQASIVTVINPAGIDFSRKQYMEMYIQGDGTAGSTRSGTQMAVYLGQIEKDADGTRGGGFTDLVGGQQVTEQPGNNVPRTEDLNHNGTLDANEDAGWTYHNPDGVSTVQIGVNNLHLDSEDLDRTGTLTSSEVKAAAVGYLNTDGTQKINPSDPKPDAVDFAGWKFVRIPLNISSGSISATQVKELRISLRADPLGTGKAGQIKIAKISIVGDRWQPDFADQFSTVTLAAVNTEDDAGAPPAQKGYTSPSGVGDFDSLNQINTALSGPTPTHRREQSLAIDYSFPAGTQGSSVTVKSVFASAVDLSQYGSLRFFVHADPNSSVNASTFVFRAGSDTDYWEFTQPILWQANTWKELYINQFSSGNGQRFDSWKVDGKDPSAPGNVPSVKRVGNPNLQSVSQFKTGVINGNPAAANVGEIWFDELFAADAKQRVGYAQMAKSDFELFGWGTFGAVVHDIDRNFETFTSAVTEQDRHRTDEYLNFTRLRWFPVNLKGFQLRTETPNVQNINNSTLVSVLQQGRVDEKGYSATGTLQIPKAPKLGLTYDTDNSKSAGLFREDNTDRYGTTLDYAPTSKFFLTPRTIALGYKLTKYKLNFGPSALLPGTDPFSVTNTRDNTNDFSAKLSFQPLPGFSFNPNYSFSNTSESKDSVTTSSGIFKPGSYDKTKAQTAGFDGVLSVRRWFAPRVRYTITDRETYGIPLSVTPEANKFKTVDRTATGETAWDFAWRDFSQKTRALQSLNVVSSYLIEDGDSYNNVRADYNSFKILSVRQSLDPGSQDGKPMTRQNSTIRDTVRSTQRWSPFDWATNWAGFRQPLRTLSLTSTLTHTTQRQETTGTASRIITNIYPDLIFSLTQTEYFFHAQNFMSNSQMNIKTNYKKVDTIGTSMEKSSSNGGDWRFTLWRKLDLFVNYTKTTDVTFDEINRVNTNDADGQVLNTQLSFNIGRFRLTPKFDYSKQTAVAANGVLTVDLTKRAPALQVYADLFLPAGLRLPFGDLVVFSNRVITNNTISLVQQRSSLDTLHNNTDTYSISTREDYELTSNIKLSVGGNYSYIVNKESPSANYYQYDFNSLLTIQF